MRLSTGGVWLAMMMAAGLQATEPHAQLQMVRVIDDRADAVPSSIRQIVQGEHVPLGNTDQQGELHLEERCRQGHQLVARPNDPTFLEAREWCAGGQEVIVIKVSTPAMVELLWHQADSLAASDENGKAALVYSELATRLVVSDATKAAGARQRAYESLAAKLGVSPAITEDPVKGPLMSPELRARLVAFQAQRGLEPTGVMNYATLENAAGVPIGGFLFPSGAVRE